MGRAEENAWWQKIIIYFVYNYNNDGTRCGERVALRGKGGSCVAGRERQRVKGLRLRAIAATADDDANDDDDYGGGGGDHVLYLQHRHHAASQSCGVVKRDAACHQNHTPLSESVTE